MWMDGWGCKVYGPYYSANTTSIHLNPTGIDLVCALLVGVPRETNITGGAEVFAKQLVAAVAVTVGVQEPNIATLLL